MPAPIVAVRHGEVLERRRPHGCGVRRGLGRMPAGHVSTSSRTTARIRPGAPRAPGLSLAHPHTVHISPYAVDEVESDTLARIKQ